MPVLGLAQEPQSIALSWVFNMMTGQASGSSGLLSFTEYCSSSCVDRMLHLLCAGDRAWLVACCALCALLLTAKIRVPESCQVCFSNRVLSLMNCSSKYLFQWACSACVCGCRLMALRSFCVRNAVFVSRLAGMAGASGLPYQYQKIFLLKPEHSLQHGVRRDVNVCVVADKMAFWHCAHFSCY